MDDPLTMLRSLRATRRFLPDAISDADLAVILEAARWTGSARNRQPWRIVGVSEPARRAQLARLGAYAGFLEAAPLVLLLAIDRRTGGADAEFDAGRIAQTIMLAAHARGLGSCPASFFPAANVTAASAIAGLGDRWRVRTAIAVGRPDPAPPGARGRPAIPTGRLPVEIIAGRRLR